ncbi:MAG TPA: hypothetical protein VHQ65_07020 [Thermoanaerobaculia bacterium]|nr:hypothetical protein [Thermoanaerobaculia bacterium]
MTYRLTGIPLAAAALLLCAPAAAQPETIGGEFNQSLWQCSNECRLPTLAYDCSGHWSNWIAIWFPRNGADACLQDLRAEQNAWCAQRGDNISPCCAYDNAASCADGGMAEACTCKGKAQFAYYQQCDGRDPYHSAGSAGTNYCCETWCGTAENDPPPADDGDTQSRPEGTPIVVALDGPFRFTDLGGGVSFDLDADGWAERVSWTVAGSRQGFLVLDRNDDLRIDSGHELFGDRTPQPGSAERNGYRALRTLDHPSWGGNADGWVSADDHLAALLRLWLDENHDGISQPSELFTLEEQGVEAISLEPVVSNRRDRHGNRLRWVSHVRFSAGGKRLAAADVILLTADP